MSFPITYVPPPPPPPPPHPPAPVLSTIPKPSGNGGPLEGDPCPRPPPPPPKPPGMKSGPPPPPPPKKGLPPPQPPQPMAKGSKLTRPPLGPTRSSNTASGNGVGLEGEADAPKAKLKPLFWDKIPADPDHSMVWHQIKSGSFK